MTSGFNNFIDFPKKSTDQKVQNHQIKFRPEFGGMRQERHPACKTLGQCFTDRMPFLSPNQQCQSTEGKMLKSCFYIVGNTFVIVCKKLGLFLRSC